MVGILIAEGACVTGDSVPFLETFSFGPKGFDGARDVAAEDVGVLNDKKGVILDFPVDRVSSKGGILNKDLRTLRFRDGALLDLKASSCFWDDGCYVRHICG